jgi:hypothetical protein
MTFCTDIDLLHWEPNLCRDAAFASQTLLAGTGDLTDASFTIAAGSFIASHVTSDQVIVLTGATSGCYPIVSVDSATQLTLSVLYDGLFPASGDPIPTPAGDATALSFVIRTFWPQRRVVSDLLMQAAGLDPASSNVESAIVVPTVLRRACTLGTLQMIYSALAAAATEPANYQVRTELYERLYRRALRSAVVELDLDGDGEADAVRALNVLTLQRI